MINWIKKLITKYKEDKEDKKYMYSPLHSFVFVDSFGWPLSDIKAEAEMTWERRKSMLNYANENDVEIKLTDQKDYSEQGKQIKKYYFEVWRKK